MKFFEMFLSGGIIMWFILLCMIAALVIIIQKFIDIRKSKNSVGTFSLKIRGMLKKKDIPNAISYCMEEKTSIANIIRRGLKKYKLGRKRVVEATESAARMEIKKIEKGLPILATVAYGTPMLGFLGTIIGLIITFMKIQEANGTAVLSNLSGGIWQALLTSAFGLIVGILAMAFYNYFITAISKNIHEMEMMALDILDVLDSSDSDFNEDENENEEE